MGSFPSGGLLSLSHILFVFETCFVEGFMYKHTILHTHIMLSLYYYCQVTLKLFKDVKITNTSFLTNKLKNLRHSKQKCHNQRQPILLNSIKLCKSIPENELAITLMFLPDYL